MLDNRAYSGVVTLREGEAAVVATEMDKSQSQAISGTPGISEIPGLNDVTSKDLQQNYATLVIVMTPHVIRGTAGGGHIPHDAGRSGHALVASFRDRSALTRGRFVLNSDARLKLSAHCQPSFQKGRGLVL